MYNCTIDKHDKIAILQMLARERRPVIFSRFERDSEVEIGIIKSMSYSTLDTIPTYGIHPINKPEAYTITVSLDQILDPYVVTKSVKVPTDYTKYAKQALNATYGVASKKSIPEIKNVHFMYDSGLTVVIWEDGTKTFVKCREDESVFDEEKALAMAISKKAMGNEYKYFEKIKKWLPDITEDD